MNTPDPAPSTPALGGARRAAIHHLPLRHAVLEEIRRRITDGRYQQGSRLFEDQIAAELGVSRNPVREALQALESEGFVELEPRRGARVSVVTAARATELFEVRGALEGLMARLAAERRSDDDVHALKAIVDEGRRAVSDGDTTALPGLNTRFHEHLGAVAGNDLLNHTIQQLSHIIQWVYAGSATRRASDSWTEHSAIVDAIASGDAARAELAAATHVAHARDAYMVHAEAVARD